MQWTLKLLAVLVFSLRLNSMGAFTVRRGKEAHTTLTLNPNLPRPVLLPRVPSAHPRQQPTRAHTQAHPTTASG